MWPYHPELLDRPVPRYTSYPTAAEFGAVEAPFHEAGFAAIATGAPVSLYAHIPFCEKICWYCGCNTGAANRAKRLTAYLDSLHSEIEHIAGRLGAGHPVSQIAFGGGSPNALAPVDFVRLADHLMVAFNGFGSRLSIELDPRSLTGEWIETVGRIGISHASLGVQTFDPALQEAIGRIQPHADVVRAVGGLREAGVRSLNFDLMYGLPGQDLDDLDETLARTLEIRPERIALFGYAHLPQLLPRQRKIDGSALPGARTRFAMAEKGFERLTRAGYRPIGFDHFALPGDDLAEAADRRGVRRNFQGFTDDPAEILLGLGASAISAFPDRFVQNEKNGGRYRMRAEAGTLCGMAGVRRTPEDRQREAIISSILCAGTARFDDRLLPARNRPMVEALAKAGLVEFGGARLRITEAGRPYSRVIASLFDAYRSVGEKRFSQAI